MTIWQGNRSDAESWDVSVEQVRVHSCEIESAPVGPGTMILYATIGIGNRILSAPLDVIEAFSTPHF